MATPATTNSVCFGSRFGMIAKFTSLSDADTWATGLGNVQAVFFTNGASGKTIGATYSGGTVTFKVSAATLANVMCVAIGD